MWFGLHCMMALLFSLFMNLILVVWLSVWLCTAGHCTWWSLRWILSELSIHFLSHLTSNKNSQHDAAYCSLGSHSLGLIRSSSVNSWGSVGTSLPWHGLQCHYTARLSVINVRWWKLRCVIFARRIVGREIWRHCSVCVLCLILREIVVVRHFLVRCLLSATNDNCKSVSDIQSSLRHVLLLPSNKPVKPGDCLEEKKEDYDNCSVLCCVPQLHAS